MDEPVGVRIYLMETRIEQDYMTRTVRLRMEAVLTDDELLSRRNSLEHLRALLVSGNALWLTVPPVSAPPIPKEAEPLLRRRIILDD